MVLPPKARDARRPVLGRARHPRREEPLLRREVPRTTGPENRELVARLRSLGLRRPIRAEFEIPQLNGSSLAPDPVVRSAGARVGDSRWSPEWRRWFLRSNSW